MDYVKSMFAAAIPLAVALAYCRYVYLKHRKPKRDKRGRFIK